MKKQELSIKQQLENLETLRAVLGEEAYQEAREKLEAQLKPGGSKPAKSGSPGDKLLQARDVSITEDAHGNIIITGDGNTVTVSPDEAPALALDFYFRALAAECDRLPLGVLNEEFAKPGTTPIKLRSVYTDLDVVTPPQPDEPEGDEKKGHRWLGLRLERGEGTDRTNVLEAISRPEIRYSALIGLPGSGKTTFVNYLAARLAASEWDDLPETLQHLPPVRLVLRDIARYLTSDAEKGEGEMLWNALEADIARHCGKAAAGLAAPFLQRRLQKEGGLVLLDGLDEVPEAGKRRKCLLEAIQAWVQQLPKCRFLLTSRPYAYSDPQWQLPGFQALNLATFNERQINNFIRLWYAAIRTNMGWDEQTASERARELHNALEAQPYLADLSTRPLLLTLMTTLHAHKTRMPENRADLFEFAVGLLLNRWQEQRQVKDAAGKWVLEEGIERVIGLGETRLRAAVEELALRTHRKQGASETGREEAVLSTPADIPLEEILTTFSAQVPSDLNPQELLKYLEERAGLLIGRGEDVYTFPHRSFQEYLAACRISNVTMDFAGELVKLVKKDTGWWREVFLLGVGRKRMGGLGDAVDILNRLVVAAPRATAKKTAWSWRAALLASEAILDLRLLEDASQNEYYETVLERLRKWLAALLQGGHLTASERLQAGDILGKLGDRRTGVGIILVKNKKVEDSVPDVDWVKIPAGPFLMGSSENEEDAFEDEKPQESRHLGDYWIGRFPVTNAQYRPFWEGDGYSNSDYWTDEGWAWLEGAEPDLSPYDTYNDKELAKNMKNWILARKNRARPYYSDHPRFGAATRPVVGISWYEAAAYCRWLHERLVDPGPAIKTGKKAADWQTALKSNKLHVRLPNEPEWEKAARGPDGRRWPWGSIWEEGRANTEEAGLGETTPVGIFPGRRNSYGLCDMAGNVWEWTLSHWGLSAYEPDFPHLYDSGDGREVPEGIGFRVVRGGSWGHNLGSARAASRYRGAPSYFDVRLGFRVVLSLAIPGF